MFNHIRFHFPDSEREVSDAAKNLMRQLICEREIRFGQAGLDDFRKHPFFDGIDLDNIRSIKPPYIPEVVSPTDTVR